MTRPAMQVSKLAKYMGERDRMKMFMNSKLMTRLRVILLGWEGGRLV